MLGNLTRNTTQKVTRIGVVIFMTVVIFIGMWLVDNTFGRLFGRWMALGSMLFVSFCFAKIVMNKILHDDQTGGLTLTRLLSLIK